MTMFYQTQDGWYVGELIEDYDDSFFVKVIYAKGEKVIGNQYSLVKKPSLQLPAKQVESTAEVNLLSGN